MRLISRRSAGNRRFGANLPCTTVFPGVIPDIPACRRCLRRRGRLRRPGLVPTWLTWAARSLSAPHDRVPHCTAASSEAEPFRSSWRSVAAADAGSAGPEAGPNTCTKPGLNLGTWPEPLPAPAGCPLPATSVSVFRSCAVVELLPALYDCRLHSLMVARVVLRRSAAARVKDPPGSLGRGPLPALPGCWPDYAAWLVKWGLCDDIWDCVCLSAHGAAGSKQSAASPAELAPTTVLTQEIVPGRGRKKRPWRARSSVRLPISTMRPWSITRIRSAFRTVVRRWATTIAVRPAPGFIDGNAHVLLCEGIQCGGGFVQQEESGALQQGAGDGKALAFPAGERHSSFANDRLVRVGQSGYEFIDLCCAGSLPAPVGVIAPRIEGVFTYRCVPEKCILGDESNLTSQRFQGKFKQVDPIDPDRSGLGRVETHDEVDDGGLAAAAGADDTNELTRSYIGPGCCHILHPGPTIRNRTSLEE